MEEEEELVRVEDASVVLTGAGLYVVDATVAVDSVCVLVAIRRMLWCAVLMIRVDVRSVVICMGVDGRIVRGRHREIGDDRRRCIPTSAGTEEGTFGLCNSI